MMLIGTSFGGCLKSILSGEVSEKDVLLIITRTEAKNLEQLQSIAEVYFTTGNSYTKTPDKYNFEGMGIDLKSVKELVKVLYIKGKIHQPRLFYHETGYMHQELILPGSKVWFEVSPIGINKHPSVIEAYEKYKMLDNLTK
jgi:hypothetical protein